jgi:hypothetical protein
MLDPLTYYTPNVLIDFKDLRTGEIWPRVGPTPTQLLCWQNACEQDYRLLTGPNRGAKTTHAMVEVASLARGRDPFRPWAGRDRPCRILVIVISQRNAESTWKRRLLDACGIIGPAADQPLIPDYEIKGIDWAQKVNGAPRRITLLNGSEIQFAWAGSHDMWERIQGDDIDFIYIDEGKSERELLAECLMRLLDSKNDPKRPGGGSLLWTATGTVDCRDFNSFRKRCMDPKATDHGYYLIGPDENPAVSRATRDSALKHLSKEQQAVRGMGDTTKADAYYIYRKHFCRERHTSFETYEPDLYDNIFIVYDPAWGRTASECGILFGAIKPDNPKKVLFWKWIAYRGDGIRQHTMDMARVLDGRSAAFILVDPAINKADPVSGDSSFDLFLDLLDEQGVSLHEGVLLADNNVNNGIHAAMEAMDTDKFLFVNMEDEEMERAVSQVEMYQSKEETRYFKAAGIRKRDNECPDCLRYCVCLDPNYVDYGPNVRKGLMSSLPATLERLIPRGISGEEDIPKPLRGILEDIRAVMEYKDDFGEDPFAIRQMDVVIR